MKIVLKITTLLFFACGIVFFVGYQSGYFFSKEKSKGVKDIGSKEENTVSLIEAKDIPKDSSSVSVDSIRNLNLFNERSEYKTEVAEQLPNDVVRAFSSKSIVIPKSFETPKPVVPQFTSFLKRTLVDFKQEQQQENSSSKVQYITIDSLR